MTVININNRFSPTEISQKEVEFDMRLRTLLLEMQRTFGRSMGACLAESLKRLTHNETFDLDKKE